MQPRPGWINAWRKKPLNDSPMKNPPSGGFFGLMFAPMRTRLNYQQPAVAGLLVPAWLMLNEPQPSPACLPVGAAEIV